DPTPVEVVRGELDLHPIGGQDADVVAAHLARDVPEDLVLVVELDLEHRVWEGLDNLALHLDLLFLRHAAGERSSGNCVTAVTSGRGITCGRLRRPYLLLSGLKPLTGLRGYRPSNLALPGPSARNERTAPRRSSV